MKSYKILGILLLIILLMNSCDNNKPDTPTDPVTPDPPVIIEDKEETKLSVIAGDVKIKDEEISTYDFTKLFTITKIKGDESTNITVDSSHIDTSNINLNNQYARIILKYDNQKIYKDIEIIKTIYNITLNQEEIVLKPSEINNFDFKSLFKLSKDDNTIDILDEYISNNIENIPGNYEYQVSYQDITNNIISKTLKVNIVPEHIIDIIKRYQSTDIEISKINELDVLSLFKIYVDNQSIEVKDEYLTYDLNDIYVNKTIPITINYELDGVKESTKCYINIVKDNEILVETKNVVTYPNSPIIDLSSLFVIKYGDKVLTTPLENITGNVDLSTPGINTITLNYNNNIYTSTVEVIHGVVITPKSDIIKIKQGTNINTYDFASDFILSINGIRYRSIPDAYLDYSNVDFNTLGNYEVTLKIPYNDQKLTLSGAKFTYYESKITYEVVPNIYSIKVINDLFVMDKDTNIFDNLDVIFNSFSASVTSKKEEATYIRTIYGEIISNIDYNSSDIQEVTLDIYPYSDLSNKVSVKFNIRINQGVKIISKDASIYTGDDLNVLDLFKITKNGEEINVRGSMIEGYYDHNIVGDYYVTLSYENISATARISVYDSLMKGTFKTTLKTIKQTSDTDDEGYQIGEDVASVRISDFIINEDGSYTFGKRDVKIIEAIDENTQIIQIGYNQYTLIFNNGILLLIPKNNNKMKCSDSNRPFVFFSNKIYKITNSLELLSGSTSVLETDSSNVFNINIFEITNIESNVVSYYCLKNHLLSHYNADYEYDIKYGYCTLNNDFSFDTSSSGTISFDKDYNFNFSNKSGKIIKEDDSYTIYNGKVFTGTYNKEPIALSISTKGDIVFRISGKEVFSTTVSNIKQSDLSYLDEKNNKLFVTNGGTNLYTYLINLNPNDNTISIEDSDDYVGLYKAGNEYLYLNGFGSGFLSYNDNEYVLHYNLINQQIVVKYNYQDKEEYIELYIPDIYNTLTVTRTSRTYFTDLVYLIQEVKHGALVVFDRYTYGKNTSTSLIYESLKITTKDGLLTNDEMLGNIPSTNIKYVDKTKVHFGKPGFYLLVINIPVDDKIVSMNYTIEVLDINSDASNFPNVLIGIYNSGLTISINEFGMVSLGYNNDLYEGLLVKKTDNSYSVNAFNSQNNEIKIIFDKIDIYNIYYVKISGSISLVDYLINYQYKTSGNENYILYSLTDDTNTIYLFGRSGSVNLEVVNPSINNNIYTITFENKEISFKINSYSSTDGLEIINL